MFGERQDLFCTSISSRRVRAAEVGHSLLSSVRTLLLLLSLSVQQSFNSWTPMLRFTTKKLSGCQIALSYGHQPRHSLLAKCNDILFGMTVGLHKNSSQFLREVPVHHCLQPWSQGLEKNHSIHILPLPTPVQC